MAKYTRLHDWSLAPREAVEVQKKLLAHLLVNAHRRGERAPTSDEPDAKSNDATGEQRGFDF